MADISSVQAWEKPPKKRGQVGQPMRTEPREPEKVIKIIRLRDNENLGWREIGKKMKMSHQGPYLLYQRWRTWAKGRKT
jgi:hypothetical protein